MFVDVSWFRYNCAARSKIMQIQRFLLKTRLSITNVKNQSAYTFLNGLPTKNPHDKNPTDKIPTDKIPDDNIPR